MAAAKGRSHRAGRNRDALQVLKAVVGNTFTARFQSNRLPAINRSPAMPMGT